MTPMQGDYVSTPENRTASKLDNVIEKALTKLAEETPGTKEHATVAAQLNALYKTKEIEINLQLKAIESFSKQNESIATVKLKETDVKTKLEESKITVELKKIEIQTKVADSAANIQLRETEVHTKLAESAANVTLKELEIAEKKKELAFPWPVKPETLAVIGANLAGIAMILSYERVNIITSKAVGFVSKLR